MLRRLRAFWSRVWRIVKWPVIALSICVALLLIPVGYVELSCRGASADQTYRPLITDPTFQRREANTYLTYPEWHIVFAYDGLAEALKTGDEYAFDYFDSIRTFWGSTCTLMEVADGHGGADWGTRSMIHTIGVSFTAEMVAKAAYEETVGRTTAWVRGQAKTPQDQAVAAMAADYAAFLRQTPWYEYPFRREAGKLWAAPVNGFVRGWERRFGIGLEFLAKSAYAKVLAGAVAATGEAQLTIRSVVSGVSPAMLAAIPDVKMVATRGDHIEIETPRYDRFTRILEEIARQGGTVQEIAGNDDIMVTFTAPPGAEAGIPYGRVILRMKRDGFRSDRLLLDVKVKDLAALLNAFPLGDPGVEHVFDY
ncbi:MAG TPA: hypothetical protein VMZ90_09725 [Vicinamibacterales bacterium]|nr:hypothetical protein [Vicinamibacterales bacterium]